MFLIILPSVPTVKLSVTTPSIPFCIERAGYVMCSARYFVAASLPPGNVAGVAAAQLMAPETAIANSVFRKIIVSGVKF